MSNKLQGLSDADLDLLYYNAKSGGEKGNWSEDDDGYDEGGWSALDVYTGQISDHSKGDQEEHDRIDKLSKLYSENVFHEYDGGDLNSQERREGFDAIFREKDRRRDEKYIQDEPKPEPVEKLPEPPKRTTPTGPVKYSDSLKNAKSMVEAYQTRQKAPFEQAQTAQNQQSFGFQQQTDFTADRNPSAQAEGDEPAKDPQMFADQYKLDLIKSGATKDEDKKFKAN